ncbi:MAG TPA: helix-turn-helix domain-containing protein [Phycisphaerae bacterium]|nr:helix-turn-helix domain-containing protein [Phycisphaerae bacterium]
MDKVLTIPEAAREAEVSEKTIREAIRSGDLPAERKGQMWLIDPDDLAEWLKEIAEAEEPDGEEEDEDEE